MVNKLFKRKSKKKTELSRPIGQVTSVEITKSGLVMKGYMYNCDGITFACGNPQPHLPHRIGDGTDE